MSGSGGYTTPDSRWYVCTGEGSFPRHRFEQLSSSLGLHVGRIFNLVPGGSWTI